MGKTLVIKGADFSANAVDKTLLCITLIGYSYNSSASTPSESVIERAVRSIYMVKVNSSNPLCPTKQYTTNGITYSAIYIPSWATTFSYSVKSGFLSIGSVYDGKSYNSSVFNPSDGWQQSNSYDVTNYRGMWITLSAKKIGESEFSDESASDIGFKFSFV